MVLDPNKVYDKLEKLAVEQGKIQVRQKEAMRAHKEEHQEIRGDITIVREYQVVQNGNLETLRKEFDENMEADKIAKVAADAVGQLVDKWSKRIVGAILAAGALVPALFILVDRLVGTF